MSHPTTSLSIQACRLLSHASSAITSVLDDADGDIAALVYEADDRPDSVLCDFARRIRAEGRQVSGLVQFRDHCRSESSRKLVMLEDWRVLDVRCSGHADAARGIHIDGRWLDRMARRVETEIVRGADLVVVSRFGPLELAGRGFCRAIRLASQMRTPLLIAVPRGDFEYWTRFSSGMAVRLGSTLDDVLGWWHGMTHPRGGVTRRRACELLK